MRLVVLLIIFSAFAAGNVAAAEPPVRISELYPVPDEGDREFIELWNPGDGDIVLDGWTITDAAGNQFTFGAWALHPGGRVVVWGGGSEDARGPAWNRATAWNNGGDTAYLRDAAGQLIQTFQYGPGGDAELPAAGQSMQWSNGWSASEPTPGFPPGASGGGATFVVANVAPELTIHQAPSEARPGASFEVAFEIQDANGDQVTWAIEGPGTALSGSGVGNHTITLEAPAEQQVHAWTLEAADGNSSVSVGMQVRVTAGALVVTLPEGGVQFPVLVPGASNTQSLQSFRITNEGNTTVEPRIDISPFRGPVQVLAQGNLVLQFSNGERVQYNGPLTFLPSLGSGEFHDIHLVIEQLPSPLPAGNYGTSFAVST